ncbi:hypothetical protein ACHAQJ_007562 [Trichoderma viride]
MAAQTATKIRTRTHDEYTVGWVCALSKEQTAATAMLDDRHVCLSKPPNDPNAYTLGSIGKHNIVIACLPTGEIGTNAAAHIATWMISTFPSIKFGLMVGIGGGIPPKVRLGDVVVSTPVGLYPGVVQWDFGKAEEGGEFTPTGSLNNPPILLRTALTKLITENELSGSKIPEYLDELKQKWPRLVPKYLWSESRIDPLSKSHTSYNGRGSQNPSNPLKRKVEQIDGIFIVDADQRNQRDIHVHYGLIASGNQVIKDAQFRDNLDLRYDGKVLCVEMEAAGLMNNFPCIVIRGICDYADSQKNKDWQEYAAAVAAAFAKELLQHIQPSDVDGEPPVRDIIKEVRNDVTHIRSKLDGKDDIEILDWLTRTDYGPQQSDNFHRRQPETGNWFLESVEFQYWLATSKQSLFCPGMPGAGKTILTSIVVDYLNSNYNDSKTGIAYIYCNFRKQEEQKIYDLLASVLKQLSESQPWLPESVRNLYNRHKAKRTRPSLDEILTVLQSVTMMYSRIFIVVDALDECHCRARFISELSNLQMRNGANIFATSRINLDIKEKFKGNKEVEIRAHDEDVQRYLDSQIAQSGRKLLQTYHKEIKTAITRVVEGMFLLAQLHFETIRTIKRPKIIEDTLRNLPTGQKAYDYAYEEAMRRINGHDATSRELALLVLSWITCAKRPLTTVELQHALAVEAGATKLDEKNLVQIEDIVSDCAGLVTSDEESDIIRLVHYTTQEYFERTQKHWFPTAQTEIATICVAYLSFNAFETGFCEIDQEFEERLQSFPFYSYAARNWGHHAPKDEASQETIRFLENKAKVEASSQALIATEMFFSYYCQSFPNKMTGLHLAAFFGVSKATETLLELGHSPNVEDTWGRRPLHYAAENGYEAIVKLLLVCRANVNVESGYGQTALQLAAENGYQEIVEKLLAAGADVNAAVVNIDIGMTALQAAAENGHQEIVEKLLAAGANINAVKKSGKTALQEAAKNGHQEVIKKLLAAGANVNAVDIFGWTALQEAAENGHQEIIKKLLAAGANANAVGYFGKTALKAAAENGHQEIVETLLAAGAQQQPEST